MIAPLDRISQVPKSTRIYKPRKAYFHLNPIITVKCPSSHRWIKRNALSVRCNESPLGLHRKYTHFRRKYAYFTGKFYKPNSFLSRCTVETDTSHSLEVRLMLVPRRSSRSTSLYSSRLVSLDLMLPAFRPTLPPLAMYRALPLLRRNLMVSRSISAQVPNTDMKMLRNGFLVPSGWNIERFSF